MIRVEIDGVAAGGEGVGRVGGKVVFVAGAIPGDVVDAETVVDRGRWARAEARRLVEPSIHRIAPRCRHVGVCGGCDWQMVPREVQARWKADMVRGQLRHLGGLQDPPLGGVELVGDDFGYRNRIDLRSLSGRPAFHRAGSRELVALEECSIAVPAIQEVLSRVGELGAVRRLTLRAGVETGELAAFVTGRPPPGASTRWGIPVHRGDRGHLHEEVAGRRFRITGRAFFQVNTAGAERLCELVADAVGSGRRMLDLYAGGGLFALTAGGRFETVTAVERDRRAVADLLHNAGGGVEVVTAPAAAATARLDGDWDAVVVDPPRGGLEREVADALAAWRPPVLVYVSCDPASLARDVRRLVDAGMTLEEVRIVDMFPQTWHVETVARFRG